MRRKLAGLFLILPLVLGACAPQPSWRDEIRACTAAAPQQAGDCYATAGFAIANKCSVQAYPRMASLITARLATPDEALNVARAEGLCVKEGSAPSIPPSR